MATATHRRLEAAPRPWHCPCLPGGPPAPEQPRAGAAVRRAISAALAATGCALLPATALAAQGLRVSTDLTAEQAYLTDNQQLRRDFDWATVLRPGVSVQGASGIVSVSGFAAASAVRYARNTRDNRTTFDADIKARFDLSTPTFYVETGIRSSQIADNPFQLATETVGGQDSITTTQYRASPVLDVQLGQESRLLVRSDFIKTTESGATQTLSLIGAESLFFQHAASWQYEGDRVNAALEVERQTSRFSDGQTPEVNTDFARARASVPIGPDFRAGLRVGLERNDFTTEEQRQGSRIVGLEALWQPSQRTKVSAFGERRFFGKGWGVELQHRLPVVAWTMSMSRDLVTAPQLLFELGPTNNVSELLGSLLTSRIPDRTEREAAVAEFMRRNSVPTSLQAVASVYTQRLSVVTARSLRMFVDGRTKTLAITIEHVRTEDAVDTGPFATGLSRNNFTQRGFAVALGQRVSAGVTLGAEANWRSAGALEGFGQESITERGVRFTATKSLSSDTRLRGAARYREAGTDGSFTLKEGSLVVGIDHRF